MEPGYSYQFKYLLMCDCLKQPEGQAALIPVLDLSTCEGVSISTLSMFYRKIECVNKHPSYISLISSNSQELTSALASLTVMMNAKLNDPSSCEGLQDFPIIQDIVERIILKGICL